MTVKKIPLVAHRFKCRRSH